MPSPTDHRATLEEMLATLRALDRKPAFIETVLASYIRRSGARAAVAHFLDGELRLVWQDEAP